MNIVLHYVKGLSQAQIFEYPTSQQFTDISILQH